MPAEKETYGYSEEFQVSIAALLLREPTFIRDYGDVVDPTYFDHPSLTSLVRIGKDCFDKHGEVPSKSLLVEEVRDFCTSYRVPKDDIEDILSKVDKVYKQKLLDTNAVRERVVRFGQRQAMRQGLVQIAELVETDSGFDRAVDIIEGALRVGYNANELGLSFIESITEIPKLARREDRGFVHKIPTGLKKFDDQTNGGIGRGEIWTVLGQSGQGKSQYLVNMGAAAVEHGIPTVHITVGDLDEEDVGIRYAANLTKCSAFDVIKEDPIFLRRAAKIKEAAESYLRIKYYDPGFVTVAHIKAYLSKIYSVEGIRPGLLILDYPDEFKKPKSNSDYEAMGEIYSQIKALINQYNCACWTASQVHRWFPRHKNDVLTRNNIADSAKKVHKADGLVSINQTWDEANAGKARLWCDKNRRGSQFFLVPLDVDWGSSMIKEGSLLDDSKED